MKTKILGTVIIAIVAVVAAFNISLTFDSKEKYNLMLNNIEAKAIGEAGEQIMSEMKTYYCADGKSTENVCESSTDIESTCDSWEEVYCDGGRGDGNGGSENKTCQQFGHNFSMGECVRCGLGQISEELPCKDGNHKWNKVLKFYNGKYHEVEQCEYCHRFK